MQLMLLLRPVLCFIQQQEVVESQQIQVQPRKPGSFTSARRDPGLRG